MIITLIFLLVNRSLAKLALNMTHENVIKNIKILCSIICDILQLIFWHKI